MDVAELARTRLGFDGLRPGQEEAVRAVLGGRDVLAVMPTGSGKSAIYQLAALELPGPTIVVSPLIALQRDQVEAIDGFTDEGAVTHLTALSFVRRMGWDPKRDITLVANSNAPAAIRDGKVDAFIGSALVQAIAQQERLKDLGDHGRYDMPVAAWRELIRQHYPNTGWVRLSHDTVAELFAYKSARCLLSIEDAVAALLGAARQESR